MRRLLFFVLVAGSAACSSESSSPAATDGGATDGGATDAPSDASARLPKVHRPTADECSHDRPPGGATTASGTCAKDADCTAGKNGRCLPPSPPFGATGNECSYDECFLDTECGSGVCDCRNAQHRKTNTCVKGNCRTDAECGGRGCSPSAITVETSCLEGIPIGSFGWFCHAAGDECIDDAECGSGPSGPKVCLYDTEVLHWKCFATSCTL